MGSINFTFDYNGLYEIPVLTIGNPDKSELSMVITAKNFTFTPRFNAISEINFMVYKTVHEQEMPYYDIIMKNKLIHMENVGWFIIDNTAETNDGGVPVKQVQAFSFEYTLNYKAINLLDGTYKFYDLFSPSGTLLYELMRAAPQWSIGNVDSDFLNLYRTFDIPDGQLYGFLMDDVSSTFECLFDFDIENFKVNVLSPKKVVKDTQIMLTFDNVLKDIKVTELSQDIVTVLRVNGADNLSITRVNPIGTNQIFDFSYYNNANWITNATLRNRITAWNTRINALRPTYTTNLATLKTRNRELITLKSQLIDLQAELNRLELLRKEIVEDAAQLRILTAQVDSVEAQIRAKKAEITTKENQITTLNNSLDAINNEIGYEKYFTAAERLQLDPYIIEAVYTDDSFIVTDAMTIPDDASSDYLVLTTTGTKRIGDLLATDIIIDDQYIANQLLEHGQSIMSTLAQPSFTFELNSTNFLFVEKFEPFIKDIQMACSVSVEIKEGDWAYPALIEMQIDYENPENFTMVFGNRFRLSTDEWTFADLHNESIKTATTVGSSLSIAVEPVLNGTINAVTEYMTNNLIAANQQIQSTENNEVTFGAFGIRAKKADSRYASGFDPHQLWINNNLICMTDDNWQTLKLAIGYVNGYYGVNAQIIAGNLIAGNQLIISDGAGTFRVDANGAQLTNASFVLDTSDGRSRIVLNPQQGIRIQGRTSTSAAWVNKIYMDSAGNAHFDGDITGNGSGTFKGHIEADSGYFRGSIYAGAGTIGGWTINPTNLASSYGDYISSTPTGSLGQLGQLGLFTWGQYPAGHAQAGVKWARFDGNISADQITGYIPDNKFQENTIDGGKIKRFSVKGAARAGTLGSHIYPFSIGNTDIATYAISSNNLQAFGFGTTSSIFQNLSGISVTNGLVQSVSSSFQSFVTENTFNALAQRVSTLESNMNALRGTKTTSSSGSPAHTHTVYI